MSSATDKLKAISKLELSHSFPKQGIYFEMMRYMVEEEEQGRNVKSSTIAIDILSPQDKRGVNRDAYVRAKVLNLRKDLKQFYLSEGKDYTQKITIPKGEYKLVIDSRALPQQRSIKAIPKLQTRSKAVIFLSISTLTLAIVCLYLLFKGNIRGINNTRASSFISLFIDTDKNVDIVFGDRGLYFEYDTNLKRYRSIFDTKVIFPDDDKSFDLFKDNFPERKIIYGRNFYHTDIGN